MAQHTLDLPQVLTVQLGGLHAGVWVQLAELYPGQGAKRFERAALLAGRSEFNDVNGKGCDFG
jgi:hypothetical protein